MINLINLHKEWVHNIVTVFQKDILPCKKRSILSFGNNLGRKQEENEYNDEVG